MRLRVTVLQQPARGDRSGVRGLGSWLTRFAPARARGEVTVVLVSDPVVRRLNRRFRGNDKPTDVLSFPAEHHAGRAGYPVPAFPEGVPRPTYLGEIIISRGVAARQARAFGHTLATEVRILALHGLLHLLGYDHEVDTGQMGRAEARLRRRAGLPDGLIGRSL